MLPSLRTLRAAALALAAVAAAACAGAPSAPAGAGDPERLYRAKCSSCHRPYEPGSRTVSQWMAALDKMAPRARLTPEQRASLGDWLRAHASDAAPAPERAP
jgi:mono/diheme cytochrome c family protein